MTEGEGGEGGNDLDRRRGASIYAEHDKYAWGRTGRGDRSACKQEVCTVKNLEQNELVREEKRKARKR